jgi:hypothetical protein
MVQQEDLYVLLKPSIAKGNKEIGPANLIVSTFFSMA